MSRLQNRLLWATRTTLASGLAAIIQAASDIVRNLGAIGEAIEGVWLLK